MNGRTTSSDGPTAMKRIQTNYKLGNENEMGKFVTLQRT